MREWPMSVSGGEMAKAEDTERCQGQRVLLESKEARTAWAERKGEHRSLARVEGRRRQEGNMGFPGGVGGKEPACQCRRRKTHVQSLDGGDALEEGMVPTPVLLPGDSHGQRSLAWCSPWGHRESDTAERLNWTEARAAHMAKDLPAMREDPGSIPGSGRSPGDGNGNLLQHSCLENPMDRGACPCTEEGYSPWGLKESDTIEQLHFHFQARSRFLRKNSRLQFVYFNFYIYLRIYHLQCSSFHYVELNECLSGVIFLPS